MPSIKLFLRVGFSGDEISLQKALNMVHRNIHEYVAVLFYASWCPFSRSFRPSFLTLSSSYPSIPHFAIKESAVRPSILSKYGVHGFPTLFLLNSKMRVRYHGNRSFESLSTFYNDVTVNCDCLSGSPCIMHLVASLHKVLDSRGYRLSDKISG
ncbi:hypothetical protein V6Z12_D02G099300 [Gossypium hirsutum]